MVKQIPEMLRLYITELCIDKVINLSFKIDYVSIDCQQDYHLEMFTQIFYFSNCSISF